MKFNVASAQHYASMGRIEEWVHAYLMGGAWANPGLSEGLKLQRRWWRGPLELPLALLARCLGPEPEMEYVFPSEAWERRTLALADSITIRGDTPLDLPPLIAEYRGDVLSIRDGNHRCGAYARLGWPTVWVFIWYNQEEEYRQHKIGEDEIGNSFSAGSR